MQVSKVFSFFFFSASYAAISCSEKEVVNVGLDLTVTLKLQYQKLISRLTAAGQQPSFVVDSVAMVDDES